MTYKVVLKETEEGFAVSCPGLPGCWSQGQSEAEALANIREAIQEYLLVREKLLETGIVREVETHRRGRRGLSAWHAARVS